MLPALLFAPDPVARLDAYLRGHPTFVAAFEASVGGKPAGKGVLRVARPRKLRLDVKGDGFDYSVSSTEGAYMEVERVEKTYDERPAIGGFRIYDPRLSPASSLLPSFLLAGSTAAIFGGQKPSVTPVGTGDELRATITTPQGPLELKLLVDAAGKPTRFSSGPRSWRVTAFGAGTADEAVYRLEAPLGYVPFALPELPTPLAIGEAAPLVGWRKGGRAVDLNEPQRGRPRLLAVLDAETPSRSARPFLLELGRTLPVLLVEKGGVEDPTGRLMKRLSPPGTPMFYLVGPDGTVEKLWFGFDPAKGKAWVAEVRAAAK